MLWQPAIPEKYRMMSDDDLSSAITARRRELGGRLLILGHHYQQDDVVRHADLTGDSLKLSQLAAAEVPKRGTEWIVFCGVHFMAETADILTEDRVRVILPDLSAGCSMADMADYEDAITAWEELHATIDDDSVRIIPITYVNSSAAVKAFVGERGGACCTSSNAAQVFDWALRGGETPKRRGERIKLLFMPDQHLGRNTARRAGFISEIDAERAKAQGSRSPSEPGASKKTAASRSAKRADMAVWDPKKELGGLSPETIRHATILLWAGHCSVHKLFRPEHVAQARQESGVETVLVHPECCQEVVEIADKVGSTEFIIREIESAPPGSSWAVGTEVHLVNRLARQAAERGVRVRILSDCQCLCTTMYRIDQAHLLWVLDHLAEGRVVNEIRVHPDAKRLARLAVDRMLANAAPPPTAKEPALVD
ncbi:MAG: quinolinate synthase NadA [Phycisphaeraceae bacterium]|nr:quinolinate synthase NadA [Phycisphaeraceae bacterium]